MRTLGTKLGVLTLVLDVVKAGGAVMLAAVIVDGGSGSFIVGGVSIYWQHVAQVVAGLAAPHEADSVQGFAGRDSRQRVRLRGPAL